MKALSIVLMLAALPASAGMTLEQAFREVLLQAEARSEFRRELARGERLRREHVLRVEDDQKPRKEGASGISEGASGIGTKSSTEYTAWPRLKFPDGEFYPVNDVCLSGGELRVEGRPVGRRCVKPGEGSCGGSVPVELRLPAAGMKSFDVQVYGKAGDERPVRVERYSILSCPR